MATPEAQHALDVARRRRKGPESPGFPLKDPPNTETSPPPSSSSTSSGGVSLIDVLRILGGFFILSSALSYFITGDSILWGYRPWYTRVDQIMQWAQGPVRLTDEQLKEFDGTVPGKPIYVGLNGSIYDVSAGSKIYGPGGSYSFFAGRDASRAFISGCFEEDLTPDMRGVEETYMPVDPDTDPSVASSAEVESGDELKRAGGRSGVKKSELKIIRERERRIARKQVHDAIENWASVFSGEKGKPYFKVGEIIREPGWLEKLPKRKLCDKAQKARPKRRE